MTDAGSNADGAFTGSIPELYDRYLGPMLFEPYARDMAHRFAGFEGALLETAAGTGRVTRALAEEASPSAAKVARVAVGCPPERITNPLPDHS